MYIYTSMHVIAKIMDNNVVSDKLKVSHNLTSGGTPVVYIVHPMFSDGYIKSVIISKIAVSKMKYVLSS